MSKPHGFEPEPPTAKELWESPDDAMTAYRDEWEAWARAELRHLRDRLHRERMTSDELRGELGRTRGLLARVKRMLDTHLVVAPLDDVSLDIDRYFTEPTQAIAGPRADARPYRDALARPYESFGEAFGDERGVPPATD